MGIWASIDELSSLANFYKKSTTNVARRISDSSPERREYWEDDLFALRACKIITIRS
jgi:hypothetical protein